MSEDTFPRDVPDEEHIKLIMRVHGVGEVEARFLLGLARGEIRPREPDEHGIEHVY